MEDLIYSLIPYAPLTVFFASFLDIFFLTGLILYGGAMLGMVLMMLSTGMISVEVLILSAYAGTITGNITNYWIGRLWGETEFIKNKMSNPKIHKIQQRMRSNNLTFFIFITRFITFTRPLYALALGTFEIKFRKFILNELVIALVWIVFWLTTILQGQNIFYQLFD